VKSREVQLVRRPPGLPALEDFHVVEVEVGEPGPGEVLVRNLFLSVDPYMRARMRARKSYDPPYALGETMTGGAVGRVVASRADGFAPGDYVSSRLGWREAFVSAPEALTPLGELAAPASAYLGILGMPGMTAYVGLFGAAGLKDGDTVFVSASAGAVGSAAVQFAKVKGCRVLGSAGGPEKVAYLKEIGADHAFDYRDGAIRDHLKRGAPEGIDVYFDNVGGDHLQAAISCMRPFGRIALCGSIAMYNDEAPTGVGITNMPRAAGLGLNFRGFLTRHYEHMRGDFLRDVGAWLSAGRISYRETVSEGIDSAPAAFIGLFTGANIGKAVVRVGE